MTHQKSQAAPIYVLEQYPSLYRRYRQQAEQKAPRMCLRDPSSELRSPLTFVSQPLDMWCT